MNKRAYFAGIKELRKLFLIIIVTMKNSFGYNAVYSIIYNI